MDRLEYIRTKTDRILNQMGNQDASRLAYIHLYGVAQVAAMLAKKRNLNIEICCIAAMLHDINQYETGVYQDHAQRSALRAKEILVTSNEFSDDEIKTITIMIARHSDKLLRHDDYAELLKDSDVLAHYFYNVNVPVNERDKVRLFYVLEELQINT